MAEFKSAGAPALCGIVIDPGFESPIQCSFDGGPGLVGKGQRAGRECTGTGGLGLGVPDCPNMLAPMLTVLFALQRGCRESDSCSRPKTGRCPTRAGDDECHQAEVTGRSTRANL